MIQTNLKVGQGGSKANITQRKMGYMIQTDLKVGQEGGATHPIYTYNTSFCRSPTPCPFLKTQQPLSLFDFSLPLFSPLDPLDSSSHLHRQSSYPLLRNHHPFPTQNRSPFLHYNLLSKLLR